jgi:hypothetical protein
MRLTRAIKSRRDPAHAAHTRIALRALALICLAALAACASPGQPGARHAHAGEALAAALGPTGWLGPLGALALHTQYDMRDVTVVLFTATPAEAGEPVVGIADARRDWRGWYAHGRLGPMRPPAPAGSISCVQSVSPSGDQSWLLVAGRRTDAVAAVEVEYADGEVVAAALQGDLYAALGRSQQRLAAVRARDGAGQVVETIAGADCPPPS